MTNRLKSTRLLPVTQSTRLLVNSNYFYDGANLVKATSDAFFTAERQRTARAQKRSVDGQETLHAGWRGVVVRAVDG